MPSQQLPTGAWVLAALSVAEYQSLTPVQLQKVLFLLGQRRAKAVGRHFYKFRPYNYGPFDAEVYADTDFLIAQGLVQVYTHQGRRLRKYKLTREGAEAARKVAEQLPSDAMEYLAQVVPWAQSLSFNELVRAIYDEYPKMRANSVFQDRAE